MQKPLLITLSFCLLQLAAYAQPDRWQQRAEYTMAVEMDVTTNRYTGTQKLVYYNNSPDTLHRVFYHLFFNAFQPGSEMDVRSRTIEDPDPRVGSRIQALKPDEIGYLRVQHLEQDGRQLAMTEKGTILEVQLAKPLLPGKKTTLDMRFEGQVPLQIRRSGRDSQEGIRLTMTQWYPKMAEYDYEGWHPYAYIGREFHGVWGDFDVKLTLDASYVVGGSGYLQNPQEVGHGYAQGAKPKAGGQRLTWHFKAPNVHDFAWAADPDYVHDVVQVPGGPTLHFLYQNDPAYAPAWKQAQPYVVKAFEVMNRDFGVYPYKQYSIIQGGDGGMEYAMATMVTGKRSLKSLVGVSVHELVHSWYQMVLGTNEALYPWMDEGFTSYASDHVMNIIFEEGKANPHLSSIRGYISNVKSGQQEPLTTHADRYMRNRTYGVNSYSKGSVLLSQLSYVMGEEKMMQGMRRYYNTWKFKHPNPTDFKRVMEKTSGMELDWLFLEWIGTTNSIDYGIRSVSASGATTKVRLQRIGELPMPLDLVVTYTDGSQEYVYIPLRMMMGQKSETLGMSRTVAADWPWVFPDYELTLSRPIGDIRSLEIDPSGRLADTDRSNNAWPSPENGNTFKRQAP
ncbi:M1 family metallopeptidase [Cesiribacter andamanensis]|uniref:Aminopeptidase N n=1 Tax=Cesiribacter andamanensis AMV16 TaxID=1279009 RepID=M7NJI0_9BACT|nr:M1 family metallopeptidase [Cesiribacter andamanensis]EMR01955.1 aminopeptidase N [Cesiribacter andamanensis AMV16]